MQYKIIRNIFLFNTTYVFFLTIRQIFQVDTISSVLILSQFALLLLIISGLKKLRCTYEEILLICLVIVALFNSEYSVYKLSDILIGFAKPILFILTIASIRSNKSLEILTDGQFERIFLLYALTTIASVLIGIFYSFVGAIYPAYSSIYALLGYFYLTKKSHVFSFGFLVFLALSGKRAVLLSGVLARFRIKNPLRYLIFWLPVVLFIAVVGGLILYQIGWYWIAYNVLKIDPAIVDESFDYFEFLMYFAGGRIDELHDGLSYDFTLMNILFGKSLGYTYESLAFDTSTHKNFHFTPASLFTEYGLLFSVLFVHYIFKIIFSQNSISNASMYVNIYVIRMYLIGSLFFFLTEYGVFGYINFCIGLGLLSGIQKPSVIS